MAKRFCKAEFFEDIRNFFTKIFEILCSKVPNAVTTMATLKRLTLRNNTLSTLTPGPYLRALENLDLAYNSFCGIPHALKEAQKLARYTPQSYCIKQPLS